MLDHAWTGLDHMGAIWNHVWTCLDHFWTSVGPVLDHFWTMRWSCRTMLDHVELCLDFGQVLLLCLFRRVSAFCGFLGPFSAFSAVFSAVFGLFGPFGPFFFTLCSLFQPFVAFSGPFLAFSGLFLSKTCRNRAYFDLNSKVEKGRTKVEFGMG